jgi:hypothetical protein
MSSIIQIFKEGESLGNITSTSKTQYHMHIDGRIREVYQIVYQVIKWLSFRPNNSRYLFLSWRYNKRVKG